MLVFAFGAIPMNRGILWKYWKVLYIKAPTRSMPPWLTSVATYWILFSFLNNTFTLRATVIRDCLIPDFWSHYVRSLPNLKVSQPTKVFEDQETNRWLTYWDTFSSRGFLLILWFGFFLIFLSGLNLCTWLRWFQTTDRSLNSSAADGCTCRKSDKIVLSLLFLWEIKFLTASMMMICEPNNRLLMSPVPRQRQ